MATVLSSTDALLNTTTTTFDNLNRQTQVTRPDYTTTEVAYDQNGNLSSTTDPNGNVTRFVYNVENRQTQVTDALGSYAGDLAHTTSVVYDAVGNPLLATDALGRTTATVYDAMDRKVATVLPLPLAGQAQTVTTVLLVGGAQVIVAGGPTTSWSYDLNGNVNAVTDANGNTTSSQYNAWNEPVIVTDALQTVPNDPAHSTTTAYDQLGRVASVTDALAHTTNYQYDNLSRKTAVVAPYINPTTKITLSDGSVVLSPAPPAPAWTTVIDGKGYSGANHYTATGSGNSATWTFQSLAPGMFYEVLVTWVKSGINTKAAPYTVFDGTSSSSIFWNPNTVDQSVDPPANATFADGGWKSLGVFWLSGATLTVKLTGVDGAQLDADAVRIIQAAPSLFAYDADSNVVATTDALDHTTWYGFDALNRKTQITDALGSYVGDPAHTTTTAYDAVGRVKTVTDALGRQTQYFYDSMGRKSAGLYPDPNTGLATGSVRAMYGYDRDGNLKYATAPPSADTAVGRGDPNCTTWYFYDALNRLTSVIDPLGADFDTYSVPLSIATSPQPLHSVTTTYDAVGQVTAATDQMGRTTQFQYDRLGRKVFQSQPNPASGPWPGTTFSYDAVGSVVATTDPLGRTTWSKYDPLNRQTRSVDALGSGPDDPTNATVTVYDDVGNVSTVTDLAGNVTNYYYDSRDRVITETTPPQSGNVVSANNGQHYSNSYQYNANGNLIQKTDTDGRVTKYVYDPLGRQIDEFWLDSNSLVFHTIQTTYDAAGQVTDIAEADTLNPANGACYQYVYDFDGRMTTARMSPNDLSAPTLVELDYAYYKDGSVKTVQDSSGLLSLSSNTATTSYQYDPLSRLMALTQAGIGATNKAARFSYYDDGRVRTVAASCGTPFWNPPQVVLGTYLYDGEGRLANLSYTHNGSPVRLGGVGTPAVNYSLKYDDAGYMTQQMSADGTTDYTGYDATGQLTAANHTSQANESFSYDANGNRQTSGATGSTAWVTGAGNRLLYDGTYRFSYDNEGNRVLQFAGPDSTLDANDSDITKYTWDQRNRLIAVSHYATYAAYPNSPDQVVAYMYDFADRQIRRALTTGGSTSYAYSIYDGNNLYMEVTDPNHLSTGGASAYVSHRNFIGPAGGVLAVDNCSGTVLWGLGDNVGTVRDVVDSTGTVLDHRTYTSFGAMTQSNSTVDYAFGFEGALWDKATKLNRNGARLYDPLASVWITADPLGFASNDPNFYRYVGNNPINNKDPSGMCSQGTTYTPPTSYTFTSTNFTTSALFGVGLSGASAATSYASDLFIAPNIQGVANLVPGQPLSNLDILVMGSNAKPGTFTLRTGIDDKPLGVVTAPGRSATIATDLTYQTEIPNMFGRPLQAGDYLSGAFVEDVRAAGFDAVYAPTTTNPLHSRIVAGASDFDAEGRGWLSNAFDVLGRASAADASAAANAPRAVAGVSSVAAWSNLGIFVLTDAMGLVRDYQEAAFQAERIANGERYSRMLSDLGWNAWQQAEQKRNLEAAQLSAEQETLPYWQSHYQLWKNTLDSRVSEQQQLGQTVLGVQRKMDQNLPVSDAERRNAAEARPKWENSSYWVSEAAQKVREAEQQIKRLSPGTVPGR